MNRRLDTLLHEARLMAGAPTVTDLGKMKPEAVAGWLAGVIRRGQEIDETAHRVALRRVGDEDLRRLYRLGQQYRGWPEFATGMAQFREEMGLERCD